MFEFLTVRIRRAQNIRMLVALDRLVNTAIETENWDATPQQKHLIDERYFRGRELRPRRKRG